MCILIFWTISYKVTLAMKKITMDPLLSTSRYFGVDIGAIQEYAKTSDDIEHLRAEIRLVT